MNLPLNKQIYSRFKLFPASHMTHRSNLPSILEAGELRSYNLMRGHSYQNLANEDVQAGRAAKVVALSGRPLHDYVPLYFGQRTPMVAVNKKQNEEIVFLRFSLDILELPGVVIADGNARSSATKFQAYSSIDDLALLDVGAIHTVKYAHDGDVKRKKQAEILVPEKLAISQMLDIICFSEESKAATLKVLEEFGILKPVTLSSHWYFH